MGKPLRDLTGQRFGALIILGIGEKRRNTTGAWWVCKCDCGNQKSLPSSDLVAGKINSCGCLHRFLTSSLLQKHGKTRTRVYRIWQAMRTRCGNPNSPSYDRYGGRGIRVCERWSSFQNFYEDMGDPPDGASIERADNNGPYCLENCRWATKLEQANNTSANVIITYDGRSMTRSQWERELGLGKTTLRGRLNSGKTLEQAMKPIRGTDEPL